MSEIPYMDGAFDDDWGIRTQRSLIDYMRLVKEYGLAVQHGAVDEAAFRKWRADIQDSRDLLEEYQFPPRDGFEERFHNLHVVDSKQLRSALRRYEAYLNELPETFDDPPFVEHRKFEPTRDRDSEGRCIEKSVRVEPPLAQQRRFLERAIVEIKAELASRPDASSPPPKSPAEVIAEEIRQRVELEARLLEQCEEDVRKYPGQEESIRRSYRKAIDAIREQR